MSLSIDVNKIINCDFDNSGMTCPRCGFKAGGRDWQRNCPKASGLPRVGDELAELIKELGFDQKLGCGCSSEVARMNAMGPARCFEQIDKIAERLEANAKLESWWKLAWASVKAISMGIFSVRGLVLEAIRRADAKTYHRLQASVDPQGSAEG